MKWFKKEQDEAEEITFEPPTLIEHVPLSEADRKIVGALARQWTRDGVIGVKGESFSEPGDFHEILAEANAGAQYEKQLNPDFYDAEVEAELKDLGDSSEEWNNPSLDGIDDYGQQYYPSRLARDEELKQEEDEEDELDRILKDYENNR